MNCTNHKNNSMFQEDDLLTLMSHPLVSLDQSFAPPMSFEDPFEDPLMEPDPLLSPCAPTSNAVDICQSLLDILKPALVESSTSVESFTNKRSYDDFFQDVRVAKRQRTAMIPNDPFAASASNMPGEESTARFRPYQEKQWQAQFEKLLQFKEENGHCCVPHSYQADPILARWVKRQRYQYKKFNDGDLSSTMTTRRIQELEAVGFVWHSHHAAWQEKLNELRQFKQQTGHCNVPSHYPENVALSTWVKCQRRQYKLFVKGSSSHMTIDRFQELESLGFVFDVRQNKSLRASALDQSLAASISC